MNNMWYKTRIAYERQGDELGYRKMQETYLVAAYSVTDAEDRARSYIAPYAIGDLPIEVKGASEEKLAGVLHSPLDLPDNRWYKARVGFVTIDEATARERIKKVSMLVEGAGILGALKLLGEELDKGMGEYEVVSIAESTIVDVIIPKFDEV